VAQAAGGVPQKLAALFPDRVEVIGRQLDWSPDGSSIAVTDKAASVDQFHIFLISVKDGSRREVMVPSDRIIGDMCPTFSPDGKQLAFLRAISSGMGDIYVVPVEGGQPRRITFDNRYIVGLAWADK